MFRKGCLGNDIEKNGGSGSSQKKKSSFKTYKETQYWILHYTLLPL